MTMSKFKFSAYKTELSGGDAMILMGKSPDHVTPMEVINEFLGEEVLQIRGSGFGVSLILPYKHWQTWEKLALKKKAWSKISLKKNEFVLDLDYLRQQNKKQKSKKENTKLHASRE